MKGMCKLRMMEKEDIYAEKEAIIAKPIEMERFNDVSYDSNTQEGIQYKPGYEMVKRIFDFFSSLIVGIVLLIPCMIIASIIIIADPGNPFYMHKRVGRYGEEIGILKFRSMKKNADNIESTLTPQQLEQYKKEYKVDNDPRLLPHGIGEFIRKTSMDELPQIIFNICIKGNMSVVGPRPIMRDELRSKYTVEQQREFLSVKPGLTGYWQAYARNNAGYESGKRQEMELYYVNNRGIKLDVKILFKTLSTVARRRGAK